jgi:tetratricopeptide (TPR) repeat protein
MSNVPSHRLSWFEIILLTLLAPVILLGCIAVLFGMISWYWKVLYFAAIPFAPYVILHLNRVPLWLALRGRYDLALLLNRIFFWAPGYGDSHEGWLLLEAGRYADAREFLRPLAFDAAGVSQLTNWNLCLYLACLARDGEYAEARDLYESALRVPQGTWNFHLGLADALLTQRVEPDLARELIEQVLAAKPEGLSRSNLLINRSQNVGMYAYALASCGRQEEAAAKLAESFTTSDGIGKRALAALHHTAGATLSVLKEREKARTYLLKALILHPHGDIAIQVQKKLNELNSR